MRCPNLKIDPQFQHLLLPLTDDEQHRLENDIVESGGARDPVKVWKDHDIILDGHHRYAICKEHDLDCPITEIDFESKHEAEAWVIQQHLGRRNISETQMRYLLGKLYANKKHTHGGSRSQASAQNAHLNKKTAETIAERENVDPATVRRAANYAAAIDRVTEAGGQDAKAAILSGRVKSTYADVIRLCELPVAELQKAAAKIANHDVESVKEALPDNGKNGRETLEKSPEPPHESRDVREPTTLTDSDSGADKPASPNGDESNVGQRCDSATSDQSNPAPSTSSDAASEPDTGVAVSGEPQPEPAVPGSDEFDQELKATFLRAMEQCPDETTKFYVWDRVTEIFVDHVVNHGSDGFREKVARTLEQLAFKIRPPGGVKQ